MAEIEIRYLSGHDVERLGIGPEAILAAVEGALAAQGNGDVVLEPREHLVPDPAFDGHFNLLRAYVAPLDVAGVKVRRGLRRQLEARAARPSSRC